ncbi:putative fasciclin-like arabinogalactan protein 20 [Phtheirospermum japonicum]|uniref:Putative fasciclin-like arabinogalactan protein 20 n=1 Tax=Phtheirospermum japonicum TaxID=374723 RepID=A0A830BNK7_9LAMI|nr:putative fasciclin-like arabinogalactan protein 20 [Phtheirospermum japonicum]
MCVCSVCARVHLYIHTPIQPEPSLQFIFSLPLQTVIINGNLSAIPAPCPPPPTPSSSRYFISAATAADGGAPSLSPFLHRHIRGAAESHIPPRLSSPPSSRRSASRSLSHRHCLRQTSPPTTPLTIFAPSDVSLLTCPSCSLPVLLQELSIPGLYPLQFLQTLTFGTKIETLAPNRCLTITNNDKDDKVFVNGVEISSPDIFNNGLVVIHGLQGFVSHLSPLSCNVERMTSLSFPSPALAAAASAVPPSLFIMRLMLKDAIIRLRATGYNVVSLALRVKYLELSDLKSMTIFALDDMAIFSGGGNAYLSNFRYHVVPNKRLTAAELVSLPPPTSLPTLDAGNNLVVTTAGGGGPLAPMRINYVKITTIDLLHNSRIVIHGVSSPFPHMHNHQAYVVESSAEIQRSTCDHFDWSRGSCVVGAEVPAGMKSTVDAEDHRDGL